MFTFEPTFTFKTFSVTDRRCGMKIGTDGVLLGAWAECPVADGLILDVGAGCGLISLMMATRYPLASITGVEIDTHAVADFKDNVANFPAAANIAIVEDDFRSVEGTYDLIVCNPPFFTGGAVAPDLSRARARHAGDLSPEALPAFAVSRLNPVGRLCMITPSDNIADLELEAALAGLSVTRKVEVATSPRRGVTRILWEFAPRADAPARAPCATITVGDEQYRRLTTPFYLHY